MTKDPKIRFKKNNTRWTKSFLSDVSKVIMGQSPSSQFYTDNSNDVLLIQGNADLNNGKVVPRVWTTEIKKQVLKNDIIFSVRAPVGDLAITDYDAAIGRGVAGIRGDLFLYYDLISKQNKNYWKKYSTGSTFDSINSIDLSNAIIYYPENQSEQTQIGNFFKELDELIELHQVSISNLEEMKKGFLNKLFPNNYKCNNILRFTNDKLNTKRIEIKNIIEKGGSGGTPKSTDKSFYGGNINFLSISDISNSNGVIYSTEKTITKKGLENSSAWIVPKGAVSLAMYASVGKVAILGVDTATSQAFYNMIFTNEKKAFFVYQFLDKMEKENGWRHLISTGTQANLNASKVLNFKMPIFPEKELGKTVDLLSKLDKLIEIEKTELELLQEMKRGFLQKMFV